MKRADLKTMPAEEVIFALKNDGNFRINFLKHLKAEREKFTESDEKLMRVMVDRLVEAGIYPPLSAELTGPRCNLTPLKMVEGWGADWHIYRSPLNCPHCNADLRDPQGPPFKLEIGIEIRGLYDGVAYYQCPECKGAFSRKGTPMTEDQVKNIGRDDIFFI